MSEADGRSEGPAGSLIADLEAEGALVDEGVFTLDAQQARAKLREHRLADPELYGCLLVEVAILLGASEVVFEPGLRSLELRIPAVFTPAELEGLFAAVLVSPASIEDPVERRRQRARQLLAVAFEAAFQARVDRVIVESRPAEGEAARLELWRDEDGRDRQRLETLELEIPVGTHIELRRPLGTGGGVGVLLRQRCRLSRKPIYYGSERVSEGPNRGLGVPDVSGTISLHGKNVGRAGARPWSSDLARVHLVINGWESEVVTAPGGPRGFVAVVEVDLVRDLSQSRALRGRKFRRVMDAVVPAMEALADQAGPSWEGSVDAPEPVKSKPGSRAQRRWSATAAVFFLVTVVAGVIEYERVAVLMGFGVAISGIGFLMTVLHER